MRTNKWLLISKWNNCNSFKNSLRLMVTLPYKMRPKPLNPQIRNREILSQSLNQGWLNKRSRRILIYLQDLGHTSKNYNSAQNLIGNMPSTSDQVKINPLLVSLTK